MASQFCRITWATFIIILLVIFYAPSVVSLDVIDDITVDTTWRLEDSPIIIRGNAENRGNINVTATLRIDPGVNVKFDGPYSLIIKKELIAIGTVTQPILFEPLSAGGQWVSIEFLTDDASAAESRVWTSFNNGEYDSGSTLQYVVLDSGGGLDFSQTPANGVLYLLDANPYLKHVTIRNGQSTAVTAIDLSNLLKIENATFENNVQSDSINGRAGGLSVIGKVNSGPSGELEITGSAISNNTTNSLDGGGGIVLGNLDKLTLSNNTISNNQSTVSQGGGISLLGINATVGEQSNYVISNNVIIDNTAEGDGGGIAANSYYFNLINNRITHNISLNGDGGGIYFGTGAQASTTENIIMYNISEGAGGGVFVEQVDGLVFDFLRNVIAENASNTSHGGGLDLAHDGGVNIQSGKIIIDSNIIADNFAERHSGAMNITAVGSVTNNAILRNESRSIMFMLSPEVIAPFAGDPVDLTVSQNAFFYNISEDNVLSNGSKVLPLVNNNNIVENGNGYYLFSSLAVSGTVDPLSLTFDGSNNYYGMDEATVALNVDGLVNYNPIATQIFENVPVSPPNNLTIEHNNGSVILTWDANPETDLQGYHIYWGTDQAPDYQFRDTGVPASVTRYVINYSDRGLDASKTYYFAVTAVDVSYSDAADISSTIVNEAQTNGNESWFSEEQVVFGVVGGTGGGGGGGGGGSFNYMFFLLLMLLACMRSPAIMRHFAFLKEPLLSKSAYFW
ncbi:MAG: hypothetical protein GXP08_11570 [Gammaproteobacteria bacterium]|nr:hypothetical protein [Gammaproteobacteria bacterium]